MAIRALLAVVGACGLLLVPLSEAAPTLTPDQQLVAGLVATGDGARAALRSLAKPSPTRASKARAEIARSLAGISTATKAAPRAVGALDTPSVRSMLGQAGKLARQARVDVASARYSGARARLLKTVELAATALADFGVPLEKEFASYAVNRNFEYLPEFANFSGLSATVGSEVTEVVIGAANRSTANAGEPGAVLDPTTGLPITRMSVAVVSDAIGRFYSGWCSLDAGVITCRMRPAMPIDRVFTIAFGPKLEPGTKLLVKFRSASGDRSYAVFATR
ncbi:MAG: hypothetical protein ABWY51_02390 [Gaiellaceae bacterium]